MLNKNKKSNLNNKYILKFITFFLYKTKISYKNIYIFNLSFISNTFVAS